MKILNKMLFFVLLLPSFALAIESSCNNRIVEIFNNSGSDLMVLDIDLDGNSVFKNIAIGDVIKAGDRRDIKIASGPGTFGSSRGTVSLIELDSSTTVSELKFLHLNINFNNSYVRCERKVEVSQANYNKFTTYVVAGYHQNTKVFIVGTKKVSKTVAAELAREARIAAEAA